MDRVSDRDRSSRKSRDERDPDRDLDRDRDHKHRHRHDDEKRHESRDRHRHSKKNDEDDESRDEKRPDPDRHRRSKDEKDRQRRSRADSPEEASPRREPSSERFRGSVERPKDQRHPDGERRRRHRDDSPQDLEPRREPSSDRFRGSVERPNDEKHDDGERRRSRYRDDSPQDLAPKHKKSSDKHIRDEKHRDRERERSLDGVRDSVERGRVYREESVERHHHSSRKRKEHDVVEEDTDKRGKQVKGSDGSKDDREGRRERRRFADRSADVEDNGDYRAERSREKISKDSMKRERLDVEEDRERKSWVEKECDGEEERKSTREKRRFNDGTDTKKRRDEYKMDEDVKRDDLRTTGEHKPSVYLGRNGDNSASEKSGSAKVNINKQKKDAFQILRPELDADTKSNPHFDPSMGIDKMKLLRPKRMTFQFVDEGRWSKQAEIIKFKSQFGEAQAKELKMKQSQLAKAKGEIDNPNLIEVPDRFDRAPKDKKKDDIPEIEWWDKPFLPSGSYIDIGTEAMCLDKITIYVEHPRPIEPPAEPAPPPPQRR